MMTASEYREWKIAYEEEIDDAIEEVAAPLREHIERLQATVLTLASAVDTEWQKRSPLSPPVLNGPLPVDPDDMIDCWFGTWEETAKRMKGDPRFYGWTDGDGQIWQGHLRVQPKEENADERSGGDLHGDGQGAHLASALRAAAGDPASGENER